jgi:hypothetical protein
LGGQFYLQTFKSVFMMYNLSALLKSTAIVPSIVFLLFFGCKKQNDVRITASTQSGDQAKSSSRQSILIGAFDLNGDGTNEQVFNEGSSISVVQSNGVTASYFISSGPWSILNGTQGVIDLDGAAGAEIPINIGSSILVITHRTRSVKPYQVNGSQWALLNNGISDLDGNEGAEIAINIGSSILVITHRTTSVKSYGVSGSWALLRDGITDLDGYPGNEIAINKGSAGVFIITHRTESVKTYDVPNAGYIGWSLLENGITDLDGTEGKEIAIVTNTGLFIIKHRAQSTLIYGINNGWSLLQGGINDFNGIPGNEIAINIGTSMLIIHAYNNTTKSYYVGNIWSLNSYSNLDGLPGLEIIINAGGRTKVINDRQGTIN